LIERDYYPLKQAADILNCSKNDLIHLGVKGELPIYILSINFRIATTHIDFTGEFVHKNNSVDTQRFARLSRLCLAELEAGDNQAAATIESVPAYSNEKFIGPVDYGTFDLYNNWGHRRNGWYHFRLIRGWLHPYRFLIALMAYLNRKPYIF
jgi:hypothetical protein